MYTNRMKDRLQAGQVPIGHMIWEFNTRGIARLTELAHLDFVLIDMEHGGFSLAQVADMVTWFRATSVTPMVRVPEVQYHFIARTLDMGALGIMVPNVRTRAMAEAIVQATKYAPAGARGLGLGGSVSHYQTGDPRQLMDTMNAATAVICQIESREGLENLEEIATVPGVDVLWVGQADLSQSLGIPGQFAHPDFQAALDKVIACCRRHGLGAGIQPNDLVQCQAWLQVGFNTISYSVDTAVYATALAVGRQAVADLASTSRAIS